MEQQPEGEEEAGREPGRRAEPEVMPRIYVASLSDYNEGRLYGVWLDADQEPEELHDAIAGMLQASPSGQAEEWAIHDYEGFDALRLGEWEELGHVSRVAKGIRENGLAFAHWSTLVAEDDDLANFEEAYLGHWASLTDYAEDLLDDFGLENELDRVVPEGLRPYVRIDVEAFGRDLELGGDIVAFEDSSAKGGVYVFSSNW